LATCIPFEGLLVPSIANPADIPIASLDLIAVAKWVQPTNPMCNVNLTKGFFICINNIQKPTDINVAMVPYEMKTIYRVVLF
jgi:hypothetical protein